MDDKKTKKQNTQERQASYLYAEEDVFSSRRASDDMRSPFEETNFEPDSETAEPEIADDEFIENEETENAGNEMTEALEEAVNEEEAEETPEEDYEEAETTEETEEPRKEDPTEEIEAEEAQSIEETEENENSNEADSVQKGTSLRTKVWLTVVLDVFFIALGLNVFALVHHVIPSAGEAISLQTPMPLADPSHTPYERTPMPQATGDTQFDFDGVFLEKGQKEQTETVYKSENVSVELTYHDIDDLRYYVQDVYVRKIDYFKTAFAEDTYGTGFNEHPVDIAVKNNAICAISGDYYGARRKSAVIRNGVLYRDNTYNDVCVLYHNGVMRVIDEKDFDGQKEILNGAYQAWDFGPNLLDNYGKAITRFESRISGENPRCAVGYYEPGHYCFVVVDGRGANDSDGLTLAELAKLFEDMGCKAAYNLDGGKTACMVMYDTMINEHLGTDCRDSSDIVMITDFE